MAASSCLGMRFQFAVRTLSEVGLRRGWAFRLLRAVIIADCRISACSIRVSLRYTLYRFLDVASSSSELVEFQNTVEVVVRVLWVECGNVGKWVSCRLDWAVSSGLRRWGRVSVG